MKATGAYRRLDTLGRLVLPAELRRHTALDSGTAVTFLIDGNHLVLRANESGCVFCGSDEALVDFAEHHVCRRCIAAMPKRDAAE